MHCLSALTLGVFAVILCRPCAATSPIGEPLHWTSTGPLIAPIPDAQHPIVSVKDPTVVHHNAKWHVYATTADTNGRWSMVYLNFRNWAVPVFSANAVPGSADTAEGYLRRWVIVKFDRTIPASQRIPGYSEEMLCEVPGIAAKAVRALRAMMDRNDKRGGFHTSSEITSGADEFAEGIGQVRQWVNSGAGLVDPNAQETQSDVFKAYRIWAQDNHVGVLKSPELMHRLASIPGITTGKTNGMRWVRGLTVYLNPRPGASSVPDESVTT